MNDEQTTDLVRRGYDRIAAAYTEQRDRFASRAYLDRLIERLPPGAQVLDLGCGAGVPVDTYLIERGFRVTGFDVSAAQIELARAHNPTATYEVLDMQWLRPGEYTVDAAVSFYAIFHTPRENHGALFRTLRSFLPTGGLILVTMGMTDWEGTESDFHGVEMFWSHYDAATNRSLIESAGFVVESDEIDTSAGEQHQVVFARAV